MVTRRAWTIRTVVLGTMVLATGLAGCDPDGDEGPLAPEEEMLAPLSERDPLWAGAPEASQLPEEGKADAVYPRQFDLVQWQSPVRNQARRGVCSIFATVALMEHLYLREGTIPNPDFSEQYLQWSVKTEVGAFREEEGSSASNNLEAISRYGIPFEEAWPYETSPWTATNDPRCTGEKRPTVCWTNGEPPESARNAPKFKLPRGRYVNPSERSIKAVLSEKRIGVVAGLDFFYQAWNHGASDLPVNRGYFSEGYVLYPNEADQEASRKKPAGHAILLVGWDDDLEVPILDGQGNPVLGTDGKPKTEKGFFLFKNSWGTSGFGLRNRFGPGYGWISYRYVREFGNVYTSDVPRLDLVEDCANRIDDDYDGATDCDDPSCKDHPACRPAGSRWENTTVLPIPDDGKAVTSEIDVPIDGSVIKAFVTVDIRHTYIGDLVVALVSPGGKRVVLQDRQGGGDDDLRTTWTVEGMAGETTRGTWRLELADKARADTGSLQSWALEIQVQGDVAPEVCDDGVDNDGLHGADCADPACASFPACGSTRKVTRQGSPDLPIPDGQADGLLHEFEITEDGTLVALAIGIEIRHPYRGDLRVRLMGPDGEIVTLLDRQGDDQDDVVETWHPTLWDGRAIRGTWMLEVADLNALDQGRWKSWTWEATVR